MNPGKTDYGLLMRSVRFGRFLVRKPSSAKDRLRRTPARLVSFEAPLLLLAEILVVVAVLLLVTELSRWGRSTIDLVQTLRSLRSAKSRIRVNAGLNQGLAQL